MNEHVHDENCSCGLHKHQEHVHDENCACGLHDQHEHTAACQHDDQHDEIGALHVESHLHDEARVISGLLTLHANEGNIRASLKRQLEDLSKAVQERGGIVGHIKASCETKTVEMFSITDVEVSVKRAPEQELSINLAAIVFAIDQQEAEKLVLQALQAVKAAALA